MICTRTLRSSVPTGRPTRIGTRIWRGMRGFRSCCGVPVAPDIARVLVAAAAAMRQARVRWYLFGAQAVIIWGRPRLEEALSWSDLLSTFERQLDQCGNPNT